ncbi:NUDIX domain-containing protein [Streptomyces afghaniensis]|uniref:NUDIX domain-containing protein n=1 Tax=Streptomyces afghaniensis TaxID=66865 RepID=UPI0033BCB014
MIFLDTTSRILLGLGHDGRWELPGSKVDPGESFESAAARELAGGDGAGDEPRAARVVAVVMDGLRGVTRVSAAAVVEATDVSGEPAARAPEKIRMWEWVEPSALPDRLFEPSAAGLRAWRPELQLPDVDAHPHLLE